MHILITGGSGFIGSHIAEYHLNKGDKVHVVDDLSTGSIVNIAPFKNNPHFHFDRADIMVWEGLTKAVDWADRIYHMAAIVGFYRVLAEPVKVLTTNIVGCERLLRTAAATAWRPRILIASSSEVYGEMHGETSAESDNLLFEAAAKNRIYYAVSKFADEAFGLAYANHLDIPVTILRFFNTVGPRQTGRYGMVVPRLIEQAVKGEPITVYGSGEQMRCFCDVRDTVKALDILANSDASLGEVVNVGNDHEISINALAELIKQKAHSDSIIKHIPYEEAYGQAFIDVQRRKPNLTKFFQLTDFSHQWNLSDTIDSLIALLRSQTPSHTHS